MLHYHRAGCEDYAADDGAQNRSEEQVQESGSKAAKPSHKKLSPLNNV